MSRKPLAFVIAAALIIPMGACAPSGDADTAHLMGPVSPVDLVGDRGDNYTVRTGLVNVCAFWTYPAPTPFSATFTTSASTGTVLSGNYSIGPNPPLCMEVWNATSATIASVRASLVSNSTSWQLERIVTAVGNGVDESTFTTLTGVSAATVAVNDAVGGYVWFKFVPRDVPPPPGGQGCTPGYWRQSQHFGSWTAPYTPSTTFASAFGSTAFRSKTLLEVVWLGGGGINALGRHSVAALLNAASSNVSYDVSVAQVIAKFNTAAAGTAGAIEAQKNEFDMLNNLGCPLGRNP